MTPNLRKVACMRDPRVACRLGVVLLASLMAQGCGADTGSKLATTTAEIKGKKFTMEIADTPASSERGLMYRDSLGSDRGMVFILGKPGTYPFWMHNTRIDLDIIWLDQDGKVVTIITMKAYDEHEQANKDPASFAIELNSGEAARLGLKVGDKIALPAAVTDKVLKPAPATTEKWL